MPVELAFGPFAGLDGLDGMTYKRALITTGAPQPIVQYSCRLVALSARVGLELAFTSGEQANALFLLSIHDERVEIISPLRLYRLRIIWAICCPSSTFVRRIIPLREGPSANI